MLRLGIAVLAIILFVECWPASKDYGLLERLKRSPHYSGLEYQERGAPPPSAPPVPPVPPVPLPPAMPYPPPSFWPGHHHHHHRYHGLEYQPKFDQLKDYQSPSCDTCKGKGTNTAVSNAESETGNAVAIAISRPKPI